MEVLKVDGKSYVKASVIARDLGYTADYVGQLCRHGKVDAKLVGRSWYVNKDDIQEHKGSRYRSTQAKSVEALKVAIHSPDEKTKVLPHTIHKKSQFYRHSSLKPKPTYGEDDAELLPTITPKQQHSSLLRVNLADATAIKISSVSEEYDFHTPKLDPIKFKGSLLVSEFQEHDAVLKEGGTLLKPTEVDHLMSEKKANKLVSSSPVVNVFVKELEEERVLVPVTFSETADLPSIQPALNRRVDHVVVESQLQYSYVLSATFAAFALVFVILGLESHILLLPIEDVMVTNYVFGIENLLAAITLATL